MALRTRHGEDFLAKARSGVGSERSDPGIKLHVCSLGKYLARKGFTPERPIKRTWEQSPTAVQDWLDNRYTDIKLRAPTAGHQARAGGTRHIVVSPGLASWRRHPFGSDDRPHKQPRRLKCAIRKEP